MTYLFLKVSFPDSIFRGVNSFLCAKYSLLAWFTRADGRRKKKKKALLEIQEVFRALCFRKSRPIRLFSGLEETRGGEARGTGVPDTGSGMCGPVIAKSERGKDTQARRLNSSKTDFIFLTDLRKLSPLFCL